MTPAEHRKVSIVALNLWPDEDPGLISDLCDPGCKTCAELADGWNAKLWKLYEALMKAELI